MPEEHNNPRRPSRPRLLAVSGRTRGDAYQKNRSLPSPEAAKAYREAVCKVIPTTLGCHGGGVWGTYGCCGSPSRSDSRKGADPKFEIQPVVTESQRDPSYAPRPGWGEGVTLSRRDSVANLPIWGLKCGYFTAANHVSGLLSSAVVDG